MLAKTTWTMISIIHMKLKFYYNLTPDKRVHFENEKCVRSKHQKQRHTI